MSMEDFGKLLKEQDVDIRSTMSIAKDFALFAESKLALC